MRSLLPFSRHSQGGTLGSRNILVLLRFLIILILLILIYTTIFHYMMLREGQEFSWITGLYWTLTVMSTLGFGDITFTTDAGRIFSVAVLLTGMLFLLMILPFTFIHFFYEPWMESHRGARTPRSVPEDMSGHVILTGYNSVTRALIDRLRRYRYLYTLLITDLDEAIRLRDNGFEVVVGELDDPNTYRRVRVQDAALVVATQTDVINTSICFNVSGINKEVPIIATSDHVDSVDILELAGSTRVLQLPEMLGQWLAHRTIAGDALTHVIGQFDELLIAEATTKRTPLVGKSLRENQIRTKVGVSVVGIWEKGTFQPADNKTIVHDDTILVLAGSKDQLAAYDELFAIYNVSAAPVLVIGGGRVGRATARNLIDREIEYRLIEQNEDLIVDQKRDVPGNAADLATLKRAQLMEAPAVVITTSDDDMNVYLTIYCRRLRPDIQILSRATNERTISTLRRAGADIVISASSIGATYAMNQLRRADIVMLAEGMDLFRITPPASFYGYKIRDTGIREKTGCSIVALEMNGRTVINPEPEFLLPESSEMILIGSESGEETLLEMFAGHKSRTQK